MPCLTANIKESRVPAGDVRAIITLVRHTPYFQVARSNVRGRAVHTELYVRAICAADRNRYSLSLRKRGVD